MRIKYVGIAAALVLSAVSTVTMAKKAPELSGLELQQLQAKDIEAPKSVVFPAVITILQDAGYRIASADKDTGLVTGSASTKSNMSYNLFFGFGRSKKTPVVSAFVEERGSGSRVRFNFVLSKSKSSLYGMNSSDEEPIVDARIYQDAFERLNKEIFVRQSLASAPAAPVAPAAVPAAAAAPGSQK